MYTSANDRHSHTGLAFTVVAVLFASLLLLVDAKPISAQAQDVGNCIDKQEIGSGIVCTANDIRIGSLHVLDVLEPCTGESGDTTTVTLRVQLLVGAVDRYDVGMFINTDGGSAIDGTRTCAGTYLAPLEPPLALLSGEGGYRDLETDPLDTCGDVKMEDGPVFYNLDDITITIACVDNDHNGVVDPLGTLVTWENIQNGKTCNGIEDLAPGTSSKCRLEYITTDIPARPHGLGITTGATLPIATVDEPYIVQLEATGGTPPHDSWSVVMDTLPAGVTLDTATGRLSGTPSTAGSFGFTVQVTDSAGATVSQGFVLDVIPPTGVWSVISTMPRAMFDMTAAAAGSSIYIVGGRDTAACSNIGVRSVDRTDVRANGLLGPWQAESLMNESRSVNAAVVSDGYLYAIGGTRECMLSQTTNSVEYAAIGPDGKLGAWQMTSPMTARRYALASVAVDGYLYALGGGGTWTTPVNTVERAAINPDGSLGTWQTSSSMVQTRSYLAAVTWGGYIYALGGTQDALGTLLATVERAAVQPDGTLGPWSIISTMTTPRQALKAVVLDGYLYAVGGLRIDSWYTYLDSVERAALRADGSLGPWEHLPAMTAPRAAHAAVAVGTYLYALGGGIYPTPQQFTILT